uniref:Uncharacterized protein n=1 Tax=Triticum urartu TaxID=4572 RepID=A0A8R7V9K3_TRIUA
MSTSANSGINSSAASISEGVVTFGNGSGSVVFRASLKVVLISPIMHIMASPVHCLFGTVSGETSIVSSRSAAVSAAVSAPVLAPSPSA